MDSGVWDRIALECHHSFLTSTGKPSSPSCQEGELGMRSDV
ncbi:hypothetical protein RBSH_03029 [Rhodopirellula baltica SH28]|uniref:Uncharacterized protein n=1 Tax=Rhodopirellula baltica SH28 TaxID=993517 RepID=K5E706_RHOBT|nr:hypothetical protein RBSH_03029 [Rhodopirellula baltica SH28]